MATYWRHYILPRREAAGVMLEQAKRAGRLPPDADLDVLIDMMAGAVIYRVLQPNPLARSESARAAALMGRQSEPLGSQTDMDEALANGAVRISEDPNPATARLLAARGNKVRVVTRRGTGPQDPAIELVAADAGDGRRSKRLRVPPRSSTAPHRLPPPRKTSG